MPARALFRPLLACFGVGYNGGRAYLVHLWRGGRKIRTIFAGVFISLALSFVLCPVLCPSIQGAIKNRPLYGAVVVGFCFSLNSNEIRRLACLTSQRFVFLLLACRAQFCGPWGLRYSTNCIYRWPRLWFYTKIQLLVSLCSPPVVKWSG